MSIWTGRDQNATSPSQGRATLDGKHSRPIFIIRMWLIGSKHFLDAITTIRPQNGFDTALYKSKA